MSDLLILGSDTDAGKTTFALLWLSAFAAAYEYWKPLESGDSDTARIRQLVPHATAHAPIRHFHRAVAPPLAARQEGETIPPAAAIAAAKPTPQTGRHLLIETFGSPLSPLNENELQITLIQQLAVPAVLVSSAAVGAIGRTLQCVQALERYGVRPAAVVLLGPSDEYATEQIARHAPGICVFALQPPERWDTAGVRRAAETQSDTLMQIRACLASDSNAVIKPQEIAEVLKADRESIWHPYTSLREPDAPLLVVAAQDEFLWLADGRRVIDGISSWWTILLGHRQPALMTALTEASKDIDHVHFAGVTHRHAVEMAELLLSAAPWRGGRVFYSDNGSTAVEVALKMAYQFWCHQGEPQRTWFVGFEHGYHGDTFGAMAASRDPLFFGRFEPLLFQAEIVPVSAERLDAALARRRGQVAAVMIEPLVQGAGGMRMHTSDVLHDLAETARRHGVLFIADEALTGGGRLGPLWAHQAAGIAPDLICAAKTLAGGVLPLAATLAAPHIVAAFDTDDRSRTFFHGHSFTAHPLACAIAVANWKLLTTTPSPAPRVEAFWSDALAPLRDAPQVRDIRICGTIAAVELNVPGGYLADVGRHLRRRCLEQSVLLRPLGNVLYAMPPFCTSEASLEQTLAAMIEAVTSLG